MDRFTMVYPYYDNGQMLDVQFRCWQQYPDKFKEELQIIVVDDCSQNTPAEHPWRDHIGIDMQLWRIKDSIPWNQNGARNLGASIAIDQNTLFTDMDHVVLPEQLINLMTYKYDPFQVYTLGRRTIHDLEEKNYKPHPNSWIMQRELYWKIGGMDEDFSGWYGSDSTFRRAIQLVTNVTHLKDYYLLVYDENDVPDANTREFGRKNSKYHSPNNPELAKKRAHPGYRAENPCRFKFERLK